MKGKVVFELAFVGSKSEGVHPFLIMEDGKKVKLGLVGDNPFMHPKLKAYDQKMVELEGDFNDNGKFIATAINVIEPSSVEVKELGEMVAPTEVKEVKSNGPHVKRFRFVVKPVVKETSTCETQTEEEVPTEEKTEAPCEENLCCNETCCEEVCEEPCEETSCDCECDCEKQPCEE